MPRRPKYIPKDYDKEQKEIENLKKKRKLNYMVVVPINFNITNEYKFSFSGDLLINLRWFSKKNLRLSENYDEEFKGLKQLSVLKNQKLVECEYFSKTYQITDYYPIIQALQALSTQNTQEIIPRIIAAQDKCNQQKLIAKQLLANGIFLQQQYTQAKARANEIMNQFNAFKIPFTYAIQQYNWQFNQLEKTINGVNFDLFSIYLDQAKVGLEFVRHKTTTFYNSIQDLCLLMDPYTIDDDVREMVVTTSDGILIKCLNLQKVFMILPSFFYILKIRFILFDQEDIKKLKHFRQTGEILYPLQEGISRDDQLYETKSSKEADYIDYSPNYNTHNYFRILNRQFVKDSQDQSSPNFKDKIEEKDNQTKRGSYQTQQKVILPINGTDKVLIIDDESFQQVWENRQSQPQQSLLQNSKQRSAYVLDIENSFRVEMVKDKISSEETIETTNDISNNFINDQTTNKFYEAIPLLKSQNNTNAGNSSTKNNQTLIEQQIFLQKFYPTTSSINCQLMRQQTD